MGIPFKLGYIPDATHSIGMLRGGPIAERTPGILDVFFPHPKIYR